MTLMKRDNNEQRFNAIFLLEKQGNPDYYRNLFKNTRAFFYGMKREDLIIELDELISLKIEKPLGATANTVLFVFKNLPYLNSFTKSRMGGRQEEYIYKHTLEKWFDEIEAWIFKKVTTLEEQIIFTSPPKQWI